MGQNRESYHDITIRGIKSNLLELSSCEDEIKMMHCPVHKSIYENEMADSLAKVAARNATHLYKLSYSLILLKSRVSM